MVQEGATIYDAAVNTPWPGVAAVTVSTVHLGVGRCVRISPQFNEMAVDCINSRLLPKPERTDPIRLLRNSRIAFVGTKIYGQGFILSSEEAAKYNLPKSLLFPYAGGEDVTRQSVPVPSRQVIDFGESTLEEARHRSSAALGFVEEKVKPERQKSRRSTYRDRWWRFGEPQSSIYAAAASQKRVLVNSEVSKHLAFVWLPTGMVYAHTLTVIVMESDTAFAVLQSRVHEPWARLLSSSMKTDLRYTASDCFDTFPFPSADPREPIPAVETAGKAFYEAPARFMLDTDQGLTKTYNALKDPETTAPAVLELRRLTEAMDRAVLDAYGWTDMAVPPYCPRTDADRAAIQTFEDEVIDRLYVLNADRAQEEDRLGLRPKRANNTASPPPPPPRPQQKPPRKRPPRRPPPRPTPTSSPRTPSDPAAGLTARHNRRLDLSARAINHSFVPRLQSTLSQ